MVHVIVRGHLFTIFRPKSVCNESTKAIFGKGTQWHRRSSYAASLPSDIPKAPNQYKRVPKHERRVMVESFVKKYREEHGGKFPPLGLTKKEVGGNYYIIRKIVQELEYESKMQTKGVVTGFQTQAGLQVLSRSNVKDDSTNKQVVLEKESGGDVLEAQNCQLGRDRMDSTRPCLEMTEDSKLNNAHLHESHVDVLEAQNHLLEKKSKDSSHSHPETTEDGKLNNAYLEESHGAVLEVQNCVLEMDRKDLPHLCPETTEDSKLNSFHDELSDHVAMDSHMHERVVDVQPSESVMHSAVKDQHGYSDIVAAESHQHNKEVLSDTFSKDAKDDQKECTEFVDSVDIKNSKNDESPQLDKDIRENDAEISKRSTLWGNLKSFADGIINIWRKR